MLFLLLYLFVIYIFLQIWSFRAIMIAHGIGLITVFSFLFLETRTAFCVAGILSIGLLILTEKRQ